MFLNRLDIEKISKISKSFSNSEVFEIKQDTSSGIGAVTTLHVQTTIHGIEEDFEGQFVITISSIENW